MQNGLPRFKRVRPTGCVALLQSHKAEAWSSVVFNLECTTGEFAGFAPQSLMLYFEPRLALFGCGSFGRTKFRSLCYPEAEKVDQAVLTRALRGEL